LSVEVRTSQNATSASNLSAIEFSRFPHSSSLVVDKQYTYNMAVLFCVQFNDVASPRIQLPQLQPTQSRELATESWRNVYSCACCM